MLLSLTTLILSFTWYRTKDVLYNELEKIEELLDSLEPKERLDLVIKILPFILPKVDKIGHTYNEPFDAGFF